MSERKAQNWKFKYVEWYRLLESVFGNHVPHISDTAITLYVSDRDWIIIPIPGETNKKDSRLAQRPNLWFSLSDEDQVNFGIVYDKLASVERLRNIVSPFNERERNEIIERLVTLDDSFLTKAHRKIKTHHWSEAPDYRVVFEQESNRMDYTQFVKAFNVIDKILDERNLLDGEKRYQLAPSIDLVSGEIEKDETCFKEALLKIKPTYEVAIKVRTKEEFETCDGCLCLTCDEKGEYEYCKCPCPGFPKSPSKTTECYVRKSSF